MAGRKRIRAWAALPLALFMACAHVQPDDAGPDLTTREGLNGCTDVGAARLVVYRPSSNGSGPYVQLSFRREALGGIDSNDYAVLEASPGSQVLTLAWGQTVRPFKWDAEEGSTTFVRIAFPETVNWGVRIIANVLTLGLAGDQAGVSRDLAFETVDATTALAEMYNMGRTVLRCMTSAEVKSLAVEQEKVRARHMVVALQEIRDRFGCSTRAVFSGIAPITRDWLFVACERTFTCRPASETGVSCQQVDDEAIGGSREPATSDAPPQADAQADGGAPSPDVAVQELRGGTTGGTAGNVSARLSPERLARRRELSRKEIAPRVGNWCHSSPALGEQTETSWAVKLCGHIFECEEASEDTISCTEHFTALEK